MRYAIRGGKVIICVVMFFPVLKNIIDLLQVLAGKKNISSLGPDGSHMINPVLFLFRPREFVLADHIIEIILYGGYANQAGLGPSFPGQFINVIAGMFLLE